MNRLLSMRLTILTVLFLLLGTADLITRRSEAQGQRGISTKGYILQAGEGESVMGGNVLVKVGPRTGAKRMAVATQRMPPGFRVPEHTHRAEEVVLVFRGSGTAILDGAKYPVSEGSIVFVPPGTWHGFIASDGGMD